ncbi:MAG: class I SAM-dependent methyltransferase [Phycisphaerae bacterium]|nr:class I SAM-dependent methyltransferase [Phycisphaerae bacterium]
MTHTATSRFDFGAIARRYDRWYDTPAGRAHDRIQKQDVQRLLPRAEGDKRLLDVGCGTGHWSAFFTEMGYTVVGIDIAAAMIAVAASNVPDASFQIADAYALPFADASFDVVATMAVLEFLPDAAAAVREMARCAKPRGRLVIGTLNRLAPLNQHRLTRRKEPYASAKLLSPKELRDLLGPWGHVRMVASTCRSIPAEASLPRRIAARLGLTASRLRGPFIVAEVRR